MKHSWRRIYYIDGLDPAVVLMLTIGFLSCRQKQQQQRPEDQLAVMKTRAMARRAVTPVRVKAIKMMMVMETRKRRKRKRRRRRTSRCR